MHCHYFSHPLSSPKSTRPSSTTISLFVFSRWSWWIDLVVDQIHQVRDLAVLFLSARFVSLCFDHPERVTNAGRDRSVRTFFKTPCSIRIRLWFDRKSRRRSNDTNCDTFLRILPCTSRFFRWLCFRSAAKRTSFLSDHLKYIQWINVLKGLEGNDIPALKEFQVPKSRIAKYDEAKLTRFIDKLLFLWEFQPKLVEFYSNLLESLVGHYSDREMFSFPPIYIQLYSVFIPTAIFVQRNSQPCHFVVPIRAGRFLLRSITWSSRNPPRCFHSFPVSLHLGL